MKTIQDKTIQELELNTVLETIAGLCVTEKGKETTTEIRPIVRKDLLMKELKRTSEYTSSFSNNNAIPSHFFENIDRELKFLKIENSFLEPDGFKRINDLVKTTNQLYVFFKKFQEYYPELYALVQGFDVNKTITQKIEQVIDKYGEIKNDASAQLAAIRKNISEVRAKINQSFNSVLSQYQSSGYLDDIKESVVENRRVLAVQAMHRRKVKGTILGQSKTGSIIFIEPEITQKYNRQLNNLEFEEREEVVRILKNLTDEIRPFHEDLIRFQTLLIHIDITHAKAKYALKINGILPEINTERKLYFREAYHPILWLANKEKRKKTYPQTIELIPEQRIVVISGPNAGGKSITLKTVGLLQLMLQSGILIPVHERSTTFLFDKVLTDIGDNQSIENHLSTYSYRLKNMSYFLRKCNENTLFLIDEFGTGSDPELGGALAEIFLEEFYERQAYGIITTHYTNLKMLANELENATNANMLFDERSLEPMFKLSVGEAGSSFTFEVAQKNGIPYSLINRAKKKIENQKVRFDKTIAKLQKERSKLEKTSEVLRQEEGKAREESKKMESINQKIQSKLESYQELFDSNQKLIYIGQKVDELSEKYFYDKNKKNLIGELLKVIEIENSKRKQTQKKERKIQKVKAEKVKQEVEQKVEQIREEKKVKKQQEKTEKKSNQTYFALKIGDRVRMLEGKAVGTIEKIEKNVASVNYGLFMSKVSIEQLEMVERKK